MRAAQPWRTNRARVLRANAVSAERVLWSKLRNRQLSGRKFVRQLPIADYFADFACREAMLVIEIDGETHHTDKQQAHDAKRAAAIDAAGYRIVRFSNHDIYNEIEGVMRRISEELTADRGPHAHLPLTPPSPR